MNLSALWKIIWKTTVAFIVVVVAGFGASQAGWSGANLVVNGQLMSVFEDFINGLYCTIGAAMCYGSFLLLQWIAKPARWLMVPVCLYSGLVSGVWDGFFSDFDYTRGQAIVHHKANAYTIEHMGERGRYLSCNDDRIARTEDAEAACARALTVGPGQRIPGSEHRCGFLGMFTCFNTAPERPKAEH